MPQAECATLLELFLPECTSRIWISGRQRALLSGCSPWSLGESSAPLWANLQGPPGGTSAPVATRILPSMKPSTSLSLATLYGNLRLFLAESVPLS